MQLSRLPLGGCKQYGFANGHSLDRLLAGCGTICVASKASQKMAGLIFHHGMGSPDPDEL